MIAPPLSVTVQSHELWPLLQFAPFSTVVVDATGTIVFANARLGALFGYAPEALVDQPLSVLVPERLRAAHEDHHRAYLRSPQSRPMGNGLALTGRHSDGHTFGIEVGLASFRSPDGQWVMALVTPTAAPVDVAHAVAEERNRIARELHDAVSQSLFAASANADALPTLVDTQPDEAQDRAKEIRKLTRGALAELRTVLFELRPKAIEAAPLRDLLRQLADAASGRSHIAVSLELSGDAADPPLAVKTAIYRIAQEALNNVVRHARAEHAWLRLDRRAGRVTLTIIDDGVGFEPAAVTGDHLGLSIMRERAQAAGAAVQVASTPGHGTTVTVRWPAPEPAP